MDITPHVLFKNVKPVSSRQVQDESVDIRISDGVISEIGQNLSSGDGVEVYEADGAYISPGWMDMHVHLREPGQEHKETIQTGCNAAAAGGFTAVACMPNTKPPIHTRDVVEFIIKKAQEHVVDVYPIACVTKDRKGESITEMADLQAGGAVAFSDDGDPVYNARVMRTALDYSSMLGMPIINHEENYELSRPGYMHEGRVSTELGLEGTPGIAEEVMIARDILLAEFTGGHIHVAHISTKRAVGLVRDAKKRGINITTEVCPHHFDLTDEEIKTRHFDTNCKMHPPLRTQDDVDAMIEGLADGTIDAICTDHAPHASQEKEVEFIYAPNGITGLETAWPVSVKCLLQPGHLTIPQLIEKLAYNPRSILNIGIPEIKVGQMAECTLFNTDQSWTYDKASVQSKAHNSPYLGTTFKGAVLAVYNKKQLYKK